MFAANFLIALREGVEASLIVGIVIAYLVHVGRRDLVGKVWIGVAVAAFIPLAAGAYMTWGPYTLSFAAQEILGGTLSLIAVAMVTWMILWMGKNSRSLTEKLHLDTQSVVESGKTWGIVWIPVIAVGREGVETALFVWATVHSGAKTAVYTPVLGVLAGLLVAIIIGWLIYTGAARINLRHFFNGTGLMLIFVAAGIVSYGIGDLQEANVIPGWGTPIWDFTHLVDGSVSPWLTSSSWWWILLEAMFNLNAAPTHAQFCGWTLYLLIVLPLFLRHSGMLRTEKPTEKPAETPLVAQRSASTMAPATSH